MESSEPSSPLSEPNKETASEIFRLMDLDGSGTITLDEALKWWEHKYAKINARSFFETVDKDGNNEISLSEWLIFWEKVKRSGYSNEDIEEELSSLKNKDTWVKYNVNE